MSFPLSVLPRCVALRSKHDNSSYLRSVHDESHGGSLVELRGGDGGLMDPRARFYLEPSKEHEGLIHVRCCYNNKYWVPQQRVLPGDGSARWVIGTAHEPEEDLSKPSCTLVKHIPIADELAEGGFTSRFLHSKLGKYACTVSATSKRSYMHIASDEDKADRQDGGGFIDAFTLIDVSDQKQLPPYVVFKGDNGDFLQGVVAYDLNWLQYQNKEIGDSAVLHTIFTNDEGVVRIKSNYFGKFWRLQRHDQSWVWPESTDTSYYDPDTLFRVTIGDGFIGLRNLGSNNFCKRFTTQGLTNVLKGDCDSIINAARVQIIEPVVSRKIYNVDFRLNEAKTYTTSIDGLDSQTVKNHTSETNHQTLSFSWTSTVESTWSSTVSMKISIDISIECGVPFFVDEKIDISTEFSASYTWGKTKTESKTVTKSVDVVVPPMKKVTVRAVGTNGVCDIPFSYKQKDVLVNGQELTHDFTDGLYKGVKTSDVTFDIIEEDL